MMMKVSGNLGQDPSYYEIVDELMVGFGVQKGSDWWKPKILVKTKNPNSKGSIQFSFLGVHEVDLRCKINCVELGNDNGMVSMKAEKWNYLGICIWNLLWRKKDIFSSFTYSVLSYWQTTVSKSPQNIMDLCWCYHFIEPFLYIK